jgi:hypothetical protein
MHTQSHVELQIGAEIWATVKPEKRNKDNRGTASGIWCLMTLRVVGLKRTWDGAQKYRLTDLFIAS